jgi:ribonuclease-3
VKEKGLPDTFALLGYRFKTPALLRQALTHRGFSKQHNERLEFIGDAVLNCVIARALFDRFPTTSEGDLSRMRARLVSRDALYDLALQISLKDYLYLSDGDLKGDAVSSSSIVADALEAVFGAVMVDADFETAREVIFKVYGDTLTAATPDRLGKDAKTRLQEWVQARRDSLPEYKVVEIEGEAHQLHFVVECKIQALPEPCRGEGATRRAAEQVAARAVLQALGIQEDFIKESDFKSKPPKPSKFTKYAKVAPHHAG